MLLTSLLSLATIASPQNHGDFAVHGIQRALATAPTATTRAYDEGSPTGIMTARSAFPSSAFPSSAFPSSAFPSSAFPSSAFPSSAPPSSAPPAWNAFSQTARSEYDRHEAIRASKRRSGFYVGMDLGVTLIRGNSTRFFDADRRLKFKDSAFIGGALGYRFSKNWRLEANASFRKADIDTIDNVPTSGDASVRSYMANMYFDLDIDGPIKPYIGFGTGIGSYDISTPSVNEDDDSGGAWNLMIGASWRMTDNSDLNICYRRLEVSSLFEVDIELQDVFVGLRYSF
jgi:opacity protein-like surface antigen